MRITGTCVITLMFLLATGISTFLTTWACLFGLTFGFGIVLPASTTIILAVGGDDPGAACGVLGGAQFALAVGSKPYFVKLFTHLRTWKAPIARITSPMPNHTTEPKAAPTPTSRKCPSLPTQDSTTSRFSPAA